MTHARWAACLADLDSHLTAQFLALEQGAPQQVVAFSPPADLGPIPPALGQRARDLHARSLALTAEIQRAQERVAAAQAQLRRSTTEASPPAYLNSRG